MAILNWKGVNNTGLCCKWQFARALYLSLWGTGVIFALHTINDKVICWEKDLLIMTLSHILFPLVSNSRVHFLKCCINLLPPSNFYTLHPCSKYYFVQRLWRCEFLFAPFFSSLHGFVMNKVKWGRNVFPSGCNKTPLRIPDYVYLLCK